MVEFHRWTHRPRETNKSLEQENQQLVSDTESGNKKEMKRWWKLDKRDLADVDVQERLPWGEETWLPSLFSSFCLEPCCISLTLKRAWIYLQLMTGDTYPWKPPGCSICHWTHPKLCKVYLFILAFILHLPYFCTAQAVQCESGSNFL